MLSTGPGCVPVRASRLLRRPAGWSSPLARDSWSLLRDSPLSVPPGVDAAGPPAVRGGLWGRFGLRAITACSGQGTGSGHQRPSRPLPGKLGLRSARWRRARPAGAVRGCRDHVPFSSGGRNRRPVRLLRASGPASQPSLLECGPGESLERFNAGLVGPKAGNFVEGYSPDAPGHPIALHPLQLPRQCPLLSTHQRLSVLPPTCLSR